MVGADDAMARDDKANGIFAHGGADGLGGHFEKSAFGGYDVGDFAIGYGFAEWNLASDFEDATIEWREVKAKRREEIWLLASKILVKPAESST